MGLAIVQRQYDKQDGSTRAEPSSPTSPEEPEKKKRKIVNPLKGLMGGFVGSPSEDDDVYGGMKKKGGIGYAGTIKEDVGIVSCLLDSC